MSNSDVLTAGLMLFGMEEPNEFVRIGHLERINHGTLILGSITELSPVAPQRLNTRLQHGFFSRLGGVALIPCDMRIVTLNHGRLQAHIRQNRFRRDLYDRLSTTTITAKPLRARSGDIPLLADYFIQQQAERDQKPAPELTSEGFDFMQTYPWPSNVRQMHGLMERALLSLDGDRITADAIKAHLQEAA